MSNILQDDKDPITERQPGGPRRSFTSDNCSPHLPLCFLWSPCGHSSLSSGTPISHSCLSQLQGWRRGTQGSSHPTQPAPQLSVKPHAAHSHGRMQEEITDPGKEARENVSPLFQMFLVTKGRNEIYLKHSLLIKEQMDSRKRMRRTEDLRDRLGRAELYIQFFTLNP